MKMFFRTEFVFDPRCTHGSEMFGKFILFFRKIFYKR